MLQNNNLGHKLQERISDIFNYAYANSKVRIPGTTCKEVGKIIHTGMFIEEYNKRIPAFSFSNHEMKYLDGNLSLFSEMIANEVSKKYEQMNSIWKIYDEDILFDNKDIGYICGKLNNIYISDPKRDVFGDALEIFRSKWAKQEGGQFFTDQRVTSLAMKLLNFSPELGEDIIDICAGTGGFLLAAFNTIKKKVELHDGLEDEVIQIASNSLKGQEIDREICELGNATLSSRTGKYKSKFISCGNSLNPDSFLDKQSKIGINKHYCAATNPPFGAKITIKDISILEKYELAKITNNKLNIEKSQNIKLYRRSPDILFIEQNIRMLKPGIGRLAIVIPYQILSGPQALFVRHWMIKQARIKAIIDLPNETFQPHTGTKTSLVLLRKRDKPLNNIMDSENEEIFMSIPRWIGHDRRGNPIYKKNPDGSDSFEILTDFYELEKAYEAYKNGNSFRDIHQGSFIIQSDNILKDNLLRINANFHKPMNNFLKEKQYSNEKWETAKIGDVTKNIFFPTRFKRNYTDFYEKAIPFLGGSNINQLIIFTDKWLRHDDPMLERLQIREGWILMTRSGTTGIVSSVPKAWDGFAMSEHVIRIIPDGSKIDAGYLLAFLKTDICQNCLSKGIFGSVIDEITPETIADIEIPIPKDKNVYEKICKSIRHHEISKQNALISLYDSVDYLSSLLLN